MSAKSVKAYIHEPWPRELNLALCGKEDVIMRNNTSYKLTTCPDCQKWVADSEGGK